MKLITKIALIVFLASATSSLFCNDVAPGSNQIAKVSVYPNPVSNGAVTVTSDQKIEKIEILSILGQAVVTQDVDAANSVKVNIDLESGIYLIKVTFTDKSYSTKRIWVN